MGKFRRILRRYLSLLFIIGFLSTWGLDLALSQSAFSQTNSPSQLVQKGVDLYQAGEYQKAISEWEKALPIYQQQRNSSYEILVLENLARAYQQVGQEDSAITTWNKVSDKYRQNGNLVQLGRSLTEQAQAYLRSGKNNNALALLCGSANPNSCLPNTSVTIAREQKDKLGTISAVGTLAEIYRRQGDYDLAVDTLEKEVAQKTIEESHKFALLNSLGNTYFERGNLALTRAKAAQNSDREQAEKLQKKAIADYQKALKNFQSSLEKASQEKNPKNELVALLNLIRLTYKNNTIAANSQTQSIDTWLSSAIALQQKLPDSTFKVNAGIELANLPKIGENITVPLAQCPSETQLGKERSQQILDSALKTAQNLQDKRSESFSFGALGHFYECQKQYDTALDFTQKALLTADTSFTNQDSSYLWEWQTGRIFRSQSNLLISQNKTAEAGQKELAAVQAFERSFNILEKIRGDILIAARDVQFDFRDVIEPIYRELARLKIKSANSASIPETQRNKQLTSALETIDSLRLAELQNYLNNDCVITPTQIQKVERLIDKNTAVISSLILEDSLVLLVSLPDGKKHLYEITENRDRVLETVQRFSPKIVKDRLAKDSYDRTDYQNLYDWLFRPLEPYLDPAQIKTLVFVQDGIFRTIPIGALYDGKQFLIEKYALAITPTISLTTTTKSDSRQEKALVLSVSKASQVDDISFQALPNIKSEVEKVKLQFPQTKVLQDENFSKDSLEKEVKQTAYPIVHIASHAVFGVVPEETFILIGNNNKLTIQELEKVLRDLKGGPSSVELLTISACQTAAGDERAALGLAGVAIQTGVKSALASLWSVDDRSTFELISEFYTNLVERKMTKAESLRQAQIKLIKTKQEDRINNDYDNPYFWAAFVLIGDWS
ncbi:CHAT domain-containing protein [Merismopedia glauca]|nr:CHAT domain-containing protein [Merismopedia glauca]